MFLRSVREQRLWQVRNNWAQCYKTFLSVNYRSSYEAWAFVFGKLFQSSLTNTHAYYENPYITDKKSFITLDQFRPPQQLLLGTLSIYRKLNPRDSTFVYFPSGCHIVTPFFYLIRHALSRNTDFLKKWWFFQGHRWSDRRTRVAGRRLVEHAASHQLARIENATAGIQVNSGATTFSIMTLSITTLSIMTLSIMTLSIMTLSRKSLFVTLSITALYEVLLFFVPFYLLLWWV